MLNEDGLWVLAPGLGMHQVVAALLRLQDIRREHSEEQGAVLVLGATPMQRKTLRWELRRILGSKGVDPSERGEGRQLPLVDVTADIASVERLRLYRCCSSVFVTTRILVVDLLSDRLLPADVTSIVILNAHRVNESSGESFAVRLLHEKKPEIMVRAFSENPNAFTSEFGKVEKVLKSLDVRRVHIWPRFHAAVQEELEACPPELIEISVPADDAANLIYEAIAELIDSCIKEIKRLEKLDISDLTATRGLFASVDETIRRQLAPIWNLVPPKTRQLVSDLRTLRTLANYLFKFDAVTFFIYLDSLRVTEGTKCAWIFHSAAHAIFEAAKSRVFRLIPRTEQPQNEKKKRKTGGVSGSESKPTSNDKARDLPADIPVIEPVLEELPKWHVFLEVLEEARAERSKHAHESTHTPPIVVFCRDDFTRLQLLEVMHHGPSGYMTLKYETLDPLSIARRPSSGPLSNNGDSYGMDSQARRQSAPHHHHHHHPCHQQQQEGPSSNATANSQTRNVPRMMGGSTSRQDTALSKEAKSLRMPGAAGVNMTGAHHQRGSSTKKPTEEEAVDARNETTEAEGSAGDENAWSGLEIVEEGDTVFVSLDDSGITPLWALHPIFVVVYDPDVTLTRALEVYKAQSKGEHVRVYLLRYENSPEMDKYQASVVRERTSFEDIIRNKGVMAPPTSRRTRPQGANANAMVVRGSTSSNALTRQAGGRVQHAVSDRVKIVVDVREFMSSLPAVLHAQGLELVPVTLEIGDYVLSPDICVERKTLADLKSSLFSGRLYQQAASMCQHYQTALLLIEFDGDRAFAMQGVGELGSDIQAGSLMSRLVLLCLHHPRLRLAWSRSLHATADLFKQLKKHHDEPDPVAAATVGLMPGEDSGAETLTNGPALEVLRRLPGVTEGNWRPLSREAGTLAGLLDMPLERLAEIMGGHAPARKLKEFLEQECRALFSVM